MNTQCLTWSEGPNEELSISMGKKTAKQPGAASKRRKPSPAASAPEKSAGSTRRLHLGSGYNPKLNWTNVDNRPLPGVDLQVDLNKLPWPWETSSISEIYAEDILEHLYPLGKAEGQENILALMEEIWRVLKPSGTIHIKVPSTDGRGAWQDPTHVTYWNINTFSYFDPRTAIWQLYAPPFQFRIKSLNNTTGQGEIVWVRADLAAMKDERT